MRAVLCKTLGLPSDLVVEDLAEPAPGPGEITVRVGAAALNFFDTLIIRGKYQYQPEMPFSPGAEMAGTVAAIGEGVTRFRPGDRVVGYRKWGCCREIVALNEEDLIAIPDTLDFETAAGLIVIYGTTLYALEERAGLMAGETLVVLGASGGVGQAAIELGKAMGARVIACASSDDKLDFCRRHGADELVNYQREDLKVRLKELTGGEGADVVYDPVGGDFAEQALRALRFGGRFLVVGFATGDIPKIPLNLVLIKGVDVRGVFWGEAVARDPDGHRRNIEHLLELVTAGKLTPHIHGVYGFDQVPEALAEIGERRVKGKVIVTP